MNPETLTALEESIAHWEKNAIAERPSDAEIDGDSCALCALFHPDSDSGCAGCPVEEATGRNFCLGSPWIRANATLSLWRKVSLNTWLTVSEVKYDNDARGNAFRAAARAEVDFLRGLLPTSGDMS